MQRCRGHRLRGHFETLRRGVVQPRGAAAVLPEARAEGSAGVRDPAVDAIAAQVSADETVDSAAPGLLYYCDPWDDPAWFVYRNAPAPLIPSRQDRIAGMQQSDTPKGVLNENLGVEELCPNGFLSSQSLPVSGGHCLIAGSEAPTLDVSDQTRHIRDPCDASHNLALQTGQWKLVRPGYAVLDTACSRAIIGADTLDQWSAHLCELGLTVVHGTGEPAHFRFGNGEVLSSTRVASIPVGLSGICGFCTVYAIPGGTPFLLSLAMFKALKATIDLGDM